MSSRARARCEINESVPTLQQYYGAPRFSAAKCCSQRFRATLRLCLKPLDQKIRSSPAPDRRDRLVGDVRVLEGRAVFGKDQPTASAFGEARAWVP